MYVCVCIVLIGVILLISLKEEKNTNLPLYIHISKIYKFWLWIIIYKRIYLWRIFFKINFKIFKLFRSNQSLIFEWNSIVFNRPIFILLVFFFFFFAFYLFIIWKKNKTINYFTCSIKNLSFFFFIVYTTSRRSRLFQSERSLVVVLGGKKIKTLLSVS